MPAANTIATSPSPYQWPSLHDAAVTSSEGPVHYSTYLSSWLATHTEWFDDGRNGLLPPQAREHANADSAVEGGVSVDDGLDTVRRLNAALLARDVPPPAPPPAHAGKSRSAKDAATDPAQQRRRIDNPVPLLAVEDVVALASEEGAQPRFRLTPPLEWERKLSAATQWLCAGVSAADGPRHAFTTQSLVQRALEHVMLAVPPSPSLPESKDQDPALLLDAKRYGVDTLLKHEEAHQQQRSVPRYLRAVAEFRPSLVLLLFHRHSAVRVWARERLLDCLHAAANVRVTGDSLAQHDGGDTVPTWEGHDKNTANNAAAAAAAATTALAEGELRHRALWLVACQLLCVLRHVSQARIPLFGHGDGGSPSLTAVSKDSTTLVGEATYHLCIVLTVLDERLAAATVASSPAPQITSPHKAMPLLLGGTLVLYWLSHSLEELATLYLRSWRRGGSITDGGDRVGSDPDGTKAVQAKALRWAARDLLHGLNSQLKHDRTVQPTSLATDAKKAIVKMLVHGLLDNARTGDDSAAAHLRENRMCQLWAIAGEVDAPPVSVPHRGGGIGGPPGAGATTAKCAGWMLEPLLKNASSQLDLKQAVALAAARPASHRPSLPDQQQQQQQQNAAARDLRSGVASKRGGGGVMGMTPYVRPGATPASPPPSHSSSSTAAAPPPPTTAPNAAQDKDSGAATTTTTTTLERAVQAYSLLLRTLVSALPAFAASPLLHGALVQHQQDLVNIAIGGVLHRASASAVRLFELLLHTDLLAFSATTDSADSALPPSTAAIASTSSSASHSGGLSTCLERAWENYPKLIRYAIEFQPRPPATGAGAAVAAAAPHILVQLVEVLHVLVDSPSVARWLLMLPSPERGGPVPLAWKVRSCLDEMLGLLRTRAADVHRQWVAAAAGPAVGGGESSSNSSNNAMSKLLAANSAIPRIVHTLAYAQCPQLRGLSEQLNDVFLRDMAAPVHRAFATDAAEWLWTRVILSHPLLRASGGGGGGDTPASVGASAVAEADHHSSPWLKLHDAKVDNLARHWGLTWLPILTHCNWSSDTLAESAVHVAAAWWMCALLADVTTIDDPNMRHDFVEKFLTRLPTPQCLSAPETTGTGGAIPSSPSPSHAQDAVYAAVRQVLLSLLEKHALYPPAQLVAAVLHVAGALPPPRAEADAKLKADVKVHLVKMSRYLSLSQATAAAKQGGGSNNNNSSGGAGGHAASTALPAQTLLQYGPAWLVKVAQQATTTIDECLADQERRLKQFELEEKAAAWEEARTTQRTAEEVSRLTASEAIRKRQLERALERQRAALPVQGLTALDEQTQPQPQPPTVPAPPSPRQPQQQQQQQQPRQLQLPSMWLSAENHARQGKRPDPFNDIITTTTTTTGTGTGLAVTANPAPTASQVRRQQANQVQLREIEYALTEDKVRARLQSVVGHTDPLQEDPYIGDIIGTRPGCLAREVPVLPEIFVSRAAAAASLAGGGGIAGAMAQVNHEAGTVYATSFVPHIALELRFGICRECEEVVGLANSQGYFAESDEPNRHHNGDKGRDTKSDEKGGVSLLQRAFPLSRWIADKALCVTYTPMRRATTDPRDSTRIDFDVVAHTRPLHHMNHNNSDNSGNGGGGGGGASLGSQLGENDILLALLPLSVALPAWFAHVERRRAEGQEVADGPRTAKELVDRVPSAWKALGCFPQVCYVSSLGYGHTPTTLSTYPLHQMHQKARAGKASRSSQGQRVVAPPPLPFLHALNLGFRNGDFAATKVLYVKRIGTLAQAFTSVRALFSMYQTKFADTLYDPRTTSVSSRTYFECFHRYLVETPDALKRIRSRLVLQHGVNDGQVKAIAAALYATLPRWDEGIALDENLGTSSGSGGGGGGTLSDIPMSYYAATPAATSNSSSTYPSSSFLANSARPRFMHSPLPEILIVEGPPGTGKTQTIATLTLNLLHYLPRKSNLLLCAPSNCAVDEALMRVKKLQNALVQRRGHVDSHNHHPPELAELLRVGVRENIGEDVLAQSPPIYVEDKVHALLHAGDDSRGAGVKRFHGDAHMATKEDMIQSAPVVFSTLGSLNQVQRCHVTFDVVIVDEASQATEPDVLQALLLTSKRCIIVGDSKQLQPTILCNDAARCGLKRSLLVRLLTNGHQSFVLRTQFRMHRDICYFPNVRYYGGKLLTDASVVRRESVPGGHHDPQQHNQHRQHETDEEERGGQRQSIAQKLAGMPRAVFVNVQEGNMERGRGKSWKNVKEARAVVAYLRELRGFLGLSAEKLAEHVGIITFYRAQCTAIQKELSPEERHSSIQIATVDSFQGKEKDIILISCVRTADSSRMAELHETARRLVKHRDAVAAVAPPPRGGDEEEEEGRRRGEREKAKRRGGPVVVVDVDVDAESEAAHEQRSEEEEKRGGDDAEDEGKEGRASPSSFASSSSSSCVSSAWREHAGGGVRTPTAALDSSASEVQEPTKKVKVERASPAEPTTTTTKATAAATAAAAAGLEALTTVDDIGRKGLGFLVDRHRINVALTRAKELCVVFGHTPTILAVADAEAAAVQLSQHLSDGANSPRRHYPSQSLSASLALATNGSKGSLAAFNKQLLRSFDAISTHSNAAVATVAAVGADLAVGSPTTVDSSKKAVRDKLKRDDEDPLALAALIAHAANGGYRSEGRSRMEEKGHDDDSVLLVEDGDRAAGEPPVHAILCQYPADSLVKTLRERKHRS